MSLLDAMRMFSSDEVAEKWFTEQRWPNGLECPNCGSGRI